MIAAYFKELFRAELYKSAQGKTARRSTLLGLVIVFASGAWAAYRDNLLGSQQSTGIFALCVLLAGLWIAFRTVNFPPFADFLVSVEAEMRKVSWPAKKELFSTTKVVLIFMALFVLLIFFYDTVFNYVFSALNWVVTGA